MANVNEDFGYASLSFLNLKCIFGNNMEQWVDGKDELLLNKYIPEMSTFESAFIDLKVPKFGENVTFENKRYKKIAEICCEAVKQVRQSANCLRRKKTLCSSVQRLAFLTSYFISMNLLCSQEHVLLGDSRSRIQ